MDENCSQSHLVHFFDDGQQHNNNNKTFIHSQRICDTRRHINLCRLHKNDARIFLK